MTSVKRTKKFYTDDVPLPSLQPRKTSVSPRSSPLVRFEERGGTDVFAGYPVLGLRKIFFRHERLKEKRKRNTKSLRGLSRTFA